VTLNLHLKGLVMVPTRNVPMEFRRLSVFGVLESRVATKSVLDKGCKTFVECEEVSEWKVERVSLHECYTVELFWSLK
jgi:hypothetical protein